MVMNAKILSRDDEKEASTLLMFMLSHLSLV